jgi:hypothetical protein
LRALLPPPDNAYAGSRVAVWFLWLQIAVNAFRGWVHVFWADSGAGRIAGIDLAQNGAVIVNLLAAIGVDQLAWGAIELGALLRYRRWIPVVLGFLLAKQAAAVLLLWAWKPLPVEAPGKYGALIGLPLVALAFWLSTRAPQPSAAGVSPPA